MRLSGPFRYRLEFDSMRIIAVENPDGGNKLSGPAAQRRTQQLVHEALHAVQRTTGTDDDEVKEPIIGDDR